MRRVIGSVDFELCSLIDQAPSVYSQAGGTLELSLECVCRCIHDRNQASSSLLPGTLYLSVTRRYNCPSDWELGNGASGLRGKGHVEFQLGGAGIFAAPTWSTGQSVAPRALKGGVRLGLVGKWALRDLEVLKMELAATQKIIDRLTARNS